MLQIPHVLIKSLLHGVERLQTVMYLNVYFIIPLRITTRTPLAPRVNASVRVGYLLVILRQPFNKFALAECANAGKCRTAIILPPGQFARAVGLVVQPCAFDGLAAWPGVGATAVLLVHSKLSLIGCTRAKRIASKSIQVIKMQMPNVFLAAAPHNLPVAVQIIVAPLADVPAAIVEKALSKPMTFPILDAPSVMLAVIEHHAASASVLL